MAKPIKKIIVLFILGLFLTLQIIALIDLFEVFKTVQNFEVFKQFKFNFDISSLYDTRIHLIVTMVMGMCYLVMVGEIAYAFDSSAQKGKKKHNNHLATIKEKKKVSYLSVVGFNRLMTNRSIHLWRKTILYPFYSINNWWTLRTKKSIRDFIQSIKGYNLNKLYKFIQHNKTICMFTIGIEIIVIFILVRIIPLSHSLMFNIILISLISLILFDILVNGAFLYFTKEKLNATGIPIVVERRLGIFGRYSRIWTLANNYHTLFIGATRRGKSATYVIPMLFLYIFGGESFIVHDPKHELYAYTKKMLKQFGYQILTFDWTNPIYSLGWNPLDIPWQEYKKIFILWCETIGVDKAHHHLNEVQVNKTKYDQLTKEIELLKIKQNKIEESVAQYPEDTLDIIRERIGHDGQLKQEYDSVIHRIKEVEHYIKVFEEDQEKNQFNLLETLEQFDSHELSDTGLSKAIEWTMDVSDALTFSENEKDKMWSDGAADMITGAALYHMEEAVLSCQIHPEEDDLEKRYIFPKEKYITFYSIHNFFKQIREIGDIKEACNYLNRHIGADSIQKIANYISSPGNTKGSFEATFNVALRDMISTPAIRSMTARSTFNLENIFDRKTAVFLLTHDEKTTYYPLISLFFKQCYEVAIRVTRRTADGRLKIPMNLIIDEMGVLPPIRDIQNIYAAAASRRINLIGFIQTVEQFELKYGPKITKIIMDNCSSHIYLGSTDKNTRDEWQKKLGYIKVWNEKKKSYDDELILTSEQLNLIAKGHSLITSIENYPMMVKLPMITEYAFWKKDLLSDMTYDISERRSNASDKVEFLNLLDKGNIQADLSERHQNEELFDPDDLLEE